MSSRVYIRFKSPTTQFFELTVTESVELNISGNPTSSPVEGLFEVVDGYIRENKRLSITGFLSKLIPTRRVDQPEDRFDTLVAKTPEEFLSKFMTMYESKVPFDVIYGANGETLKDCLITNATFSRTKNNSGGYGVTMSIAQIKVIEQATSQETYNVITFDSEVYGRNTPEVQKGDIQGSSGVLQAVEAEASLENQRKVAYYEFSRKGGTVTEAITQEYYNIDSSVPNINSPILPGD